MTSPKGKIFGPIEKAHFSRNLGPFENGIISGINFKFGIYDLLKPLQVELKNQIEKTSTRSEITINQIHE